MTHEIHHLARCGLARQFGTGAAALVLLGGAGLFALAVPAGVAGAAGTVLYASPTGGATTCTATTPCTLAHALTIASDTDTIELATTTGTYVGHFTVRSTLDGLVIETGTPSKLATLTGATGQGSVVTIEPSATATLDGLWITGGSGTAGGTLTAGGGIEVDDTGTLTVETSFISMNDVSGNKRLLGGGIFADSQSTLKVETSTISTNSIDTGSATATGFGAGICSSGSLTVERSNISANHIVGVSFASGGGIANTGTLTVETSDISENTLGTAKYFSQGAGVFNGVTATFESSTISGNTAIAGVENTVGGGGGIYDAASSILVLEKSTVSQNRASYGGGAYDMLTGLVTVATSTFWQNTALENGGGIDNVETSALLLEDSTIADNYSSYGGGIDNTTGSQVTIVSSTIWGNGADNGGGIEEGSLGVAVSLAASIVGGSVAGGSCAVSGGNLVNAGYDVSDETGCGFSATVPTPTTRDSVVSPAVDDYLGTLGTHGGTVDTVPLLRTPKTPTSSLDPALGSIPVTGGVTVLRGPYYPCESPAENGVSRSNTTTTCDAGAFELTPSTVPLTLLSPTGTSVTGSAATSQRTYGTTPAGTAAAAFLATYPSTAGRCVGTISTRPVVLASDAGFQDALSSAYLASSLSTGILLTTPGALSPTTAAALRKEGVTKVYVAGGPLAVSTAVVKSIESEVVTACGGGVSSPARDIAVTRIYGASAYGTAKAVALTPGASFVGSADLSGAYEPAGASRYDTTGDASSAAPSVGAQRTAILTSGTEPYDAEAAATLSYAAHLPLLLTTQGTLSPTTQSALESLKITQVLIVGGPLAVSGTVTNALEAMGVSVLRIAGPTASATSTELADAELGSAGEDLGFGWTPTGGLVVAQGKGFADALSGASFAAHQGTGTSPEPLVLTESPTSAGSALLDFLAQAGASGIDHDGHQVHALSVLGGPLAISGSVVTSMEAALGR